MSSDGVQAFDLQDHNDNTLSSWTNATNYPQLYAREDTTRQHEVFTAPIEESRACAGSLVNAQSFDDAARVHGSGLHPVLGTPFQTEVHRQMPVARPTATSTLEDMDRLLLHEVAAGRSIEQITQSASRQCGFSLSKDDTLLAYRSAYWRSKAWGERDTMMMEEAVHAEVERFWERVAVAMREKGCPEWPPNEIKMRFQQQRPGSSCLLL